MQAVHGLKEVQEKFGGMVVEAKLPQPGAAMAESYEGDGHLILRHPETDVVRDAVHEIVSTVRVELA